VDEEGWIKDGAPGISMKSIFRYFNP